MTRPLCLLAVCVAVFCAAGFYGGLLAMPVAGIGLAIGLTLLSRWGRPLGAGWIGCVLLALILAGGGMYLRTGQAMQAAQQLDGTIATIEGVVADLPWQNENGSYVYELSTRSVENDTCRLEGSMGLRLYSYEPLDVQPLDRILVRAEVVRPPEGFFPMGFNSRAYQRSKGVYLYGFTNPGLEMVLESDAGSVWQQGVLALRKSVQDSLNALEQPASGLLRGLLLGDKTQLSDSIRDQFQKLGISHILAVSGMHLGILAGVIQFLLVQLWGKRRLGAVLSFGCCLLYGAVAAFSPSVLRSVSMLGIMCLSILCMREYDPFTALAAGVTGILLYNPMAIGDVGLQLSAGATLGILLVQRHRGWIRALPIPDSLRRWGAPAGNILLLTGGATLFTAPLLMLWFHQLSFLSFVGNLLIVPWVPPLFVLGGLYCLCTPIGTLAPLAQGLAALAQLLTSCLLTLAGWLSGFGYGVWSSYDVRVVWLLTLLVALICVLWWLKAAAKDWLWAGGTLTVAGIILWCLPSQGELQGEWEISFVDVGQGDCAYLRSEEGNLLVDCGSGNQSVDAGSRAAEYIQYLGDTRLDVMVLTHYHTDHISGLEALCQQVEIGRLLLPPDDGSDNCRQVYQLAQQYGIPVQWMEEDEVFQVGAMEVEVLTRHIDFSQMGDGNPNEQCLVVRVSQGDVSTLLTGDITQEGEMELCRQYDLQVDLLKVAHHGSDSSTGYPFLKEVQPDWSVISCREGNAYGHPAPEVLYRLSQCTDSIFRIDLQGTLRVAVREGKMYRVEERRRIT
ncbi:MAG: DNA internalization-related competence protein ComEC/Rec2 [Eubacteriales bacterium]|jgi:competence protein ComEC